jgi:glycosyltransferase involved in cell wall biosynthesis
MKSENYPVITFVIPSLNRPTIERSIKSLLSQTNKNWRCILIYDGVLGKIFEDERIQILNVERTGLVGEVHGQSGLVRNKGLEICETEWIGFLDDDDSIHPEYVDTLFNSYQNYDFVVWRMKYENGRVLPPFTSGRLSFGEVGISFCFKNKFNLFFDTNRDGEDFDFLMKLKSLTKNYLIAPEVYYNVGH